MNRVFEDYPYYKNLYIFRLWIDTVLVASRQILIVDSVDRAPIWSKEMVCALSIKRFAIGSRAIVHPDFRNQGLGSYLVRQVNYDTYTKHDLETVFGSSTSIAAIFLYLRLGARLWEGDINSQCLHDTDTQDAETRSRSFFNNRERYSRMGHPMRYVYQRNTKNAIWDNYLCSPNPLRV